MQKLWGGKKGSKTKYLQTLYTCIYVWKRRKQFGGLALKRNNSSQQWCFNCRLKIYYVRFIQIKRLWNASTLAWAYVSIKMCEAITKHGEERVLVAYFFPHGFSSNSHNTLECRLLDFFPFSENFLNLLSTFFFLSSYFVYSSRNVICVCMCVCHMNPHFSSNSTHIGISIGTLTNSSPKTVQESCRTDCINCKAVMLMLRDIRLQHMPSRLPLDQCYELNVLSIHKLLQRRIRKKSGILWASVYPPAHLNGFIGVCRRFNQINI